MRQTEIGPLPEDWACVSLREIASISSGGTPSRRDPIHWNGKIPWVTTSEVKGNVILSTQESITPAGLASSAAKLFLPGTILLAMYGQGTTRGKVAILGISAATNQACAAICVSELAAGSFIYQFIASRYDEIRQLSNIGNQENLTLGLVGSIWVALPPLAEQHAIAEALGDVDTLLLGLDQLIEKKRAVKQAVMEQLLTGRRRLPGCSGEWSPFKLGDVMQPLATAALPRAAMSQNGSIGCIHYGDIHIGSDSLMRCDAASHSRVHLSRAGSASPLKTGDLLIADASEDVGGLGKAVEVALMDNTPFIAGLHLIALRPNPNLVALGFAQFIQFFEQYREGVQRAASGVSVYGLSRAALRSIEVPLPPLPEQQAIAEVLTALDDELRALDERRAKTQHLKRGMMASLLSGKVRLR
jgi:type I restriction enzyme S subunit